MPFSTFFNVEFFKITAVVVGEVVVLGEFRPGIHEPIQDTSKKRYVGTYINMNKLWRTYTMGSSRIWVYP